MTEKEMLVCQAKEIWPEVREVDKFIFIMDANGVVFFTNTLTTNNRELANLLVRGYFLSEPLTKEHRIVYDPLKSSFGKDVFYIWAGGYWGRQPVLAEIYALSTFPLKRQEVLRRMLARKWRQKKK